MFVPDFLDGLQQRSWCAKLDMPFKACENVLLDSITIYIVILVILGNAFCYSALNFSIDSIPDKLHGQTVVVDT